VPKLNFIASNFFLMSRAKKVLKSTNVSRNYSKNKSRTFLLDHGVLVQMEIPVKQMQQNRLQNAWDLL